MNSDRLISQIIISFSSAVEAKDAYTNGHSMRVADYSLMIARKAGFDKEFLRRLYVAAILHDIGKIGISDEILNKTGKLTDDEFAVIKSHPVIGYDILSVIDEVPDIAVGARWHHERWNGMGYPDGLKGNTIPDIAQIISVADAYDAMTSNRSYRKILDQKTVYGEIEKGLGQQFSPNYGLIMLNIMEQDKGYDLHG